MTVVKRAFDKIADGLNEALAIARGEADPNAYGIHRNPDAVMEALRDPGQDDAARGGGPSHPTSGAQT